MRYIEAPVLQFTGLITIPVARDYVIDVSASFPYEIEGITLQTTTGSCTVAVKINGTSAGGLSAVSATTSVLSTSATGTNIVSAGGKLTLTVSSVSGADNLSYTIKVRRL